MHGIYCTQPSGHFMLSGFSAIKLMPYSPHTHDINSQFSPHASLGGILDSLINIFYWGILHSLSIDGYNGVSRVQAGHERHTARHNALNKCLKNFAFLLKTTIALKKWIFKANLMISQKLPTVFTMARGAWG